jgi:ATP-dependent DNA ligase
MTPAPDYINSLEATGKFIAEQKWNGDNVIINTDDLSFWNRRKEQHRYQPPAETKKALKRFPKGGLINLELVHYRTKTIKNQLLIHSLLAWDGVPLAGKTWGDARLILEDLFKTLKPAKESGLILSPVWKSGFWKLFQEADGEIIEGIVLKNPKGKLVISASKIPDVSYMLKIRKPSKKYKF